MSEHHILFAAPIDPPHMNNFAVLLNGLRAQGVTKVTIAMNTPGGGTIPGIAAYNLMRAMPFKIVTHNIGNVDSIGNVLFLAGEERHACPVATFMFHGVGIDSVPNERLEEKNLREKLDLVIADQTRISQLIASRTDLAVEDCMELFREQKTRSAEWAKERGFVTEVCDFTFPAGGNVHIFT